MRWLNIVQDLISSTSQPQHIERGVVPLKRTKRKVGYQKTYYAVNAAEDVEEAGDRMKKLRIDDDGMNMEGLGSTDGEADVHGTKVSKYACDGTN